MKQNQVHLASEISARQSDRMLKKGDIQWVFLVIIQSVKEDLESMEAAEESVIIVKPKWDQALGSHIHAVLEEFEDVFP